MTTTSHYPTSSYALSTTKTSSCNLCKRLLYSFEEVLVCRVCRDSYHRRCLKTEPHSSYGNLTNFVCEACQNPTNPLSETKKLQSTDSLDQDEYQQSNGTTKISDLDDYLPAPTDRHESQSNDDNRTSSRLESDVESDQEDQPKTNMFQANYQYTPLKDYVATKDSPPENSNHPLKPRYGGGLQYTDHGYDPTKTRAVDVPSLNSTKFSSPTIDNLSMHNRQQNYISTTSLTIQDKPQAVRQPEKSFSQPRIDRSSTTGSDSGIVASTSTSHETTNDTSHLVEEKITNLVEKLGKQFELDSQKLNEKLEKKLKDLENMIHQQTFVIQRQDQVIESLKKQILQIENERDQYRERLSVHEQREENEKIDQQAIERKPSEASTIVSENKKTSTKKEPAPRMETQRIVIYDERSPSITTQPVKQVISVLKREKSTSSSSSSSSSTAAVVSVPSPTEKLPSPSTPSHRLDHIIHQSPTTDLPNPSSSNYSLPQVRRQDRPHFGEPISMEQQQIVTSVHIDDSDDDDVEHEVIPRKQSNTSSSSSSSIHLPSPRPNQLPPRRKPPRI